MSPKPFALSVKVLIRDDDGRCLLLRRSSSSKNNAGKWDMPGGKVDRGEDFEEALLREVSEETGLSIRLERLAGSAESATLTRNVVYLIMEGRVDGGQVRLSSEHDQHEWVDLKQLPMMDVCPQFKAFAAAYARGEHLTTG